MPKRTELVREIRRLALRHGRSAFIVRQGVHEIWECAGLRFPVPRHRTIAEGTARAIIARLSRHLEELRGEEER